MSEQGQTPPPKEPSNDEPQAARPAPDQATTPLPADPAPSATAAQAPPAAAQAPAGPPPPPPAATPAAAVPAGPGRGRRFVRHRATQLVAVGLLGLVLGGGIVGAVAANRFDHRGGPGQVRMYERGERGPDRGGDRFDQRGPFGDRGERGDRFER
ncbi:hypothetical protein [Lentzea sp. HUAS12]|uniref:hypothetical protein n=1 Tax=Lentzea sp. HUAS12 TaxID=2951806 RepID=UPI0020A127B1|nr:hypothetical protein [Lentzea sp. HUAS12]USX52376.1 hypothetical protein ND450_44900 [Lentzea sp. HUAS12]